MKQLFGLLLMMLALTSCHSPAFISGNIEGLDKKDSKIYLIQPETLQELSASYFGKIIDSATIDTKGNFKFHNLPKTQEPILFELAVQPSGKSGNYLQTDNPLTSNMMPILWQPKEQVRIYAQYDAFQKSCSIEYPSEENRALLNLRDINQKAYQTYLAGKHWQVEDGSGLLEKEQATLKYQEELIAFADSTQYFIPALVAIRWVSPKNDYERVPEFLVRQCETWKKAQPNHPWVKQLCELSNANNLPVLIGDEFPNLKLPTITKDTLRLKSQLGSKITIIDLWASWCAPCRKENREILGPLWDEFHKQGLQIIAYGLESDESAWKTAVERDGADRWLQASDLQGDDAPFLKNIRVQTIPANSILDKNGKVIAKNVHGKDLIDLLSRCLEQ